MMTSQSKGSKTRSSTSSDTPSTSTSSIFMKNCKPQKQDYLIIILAILVVIMCSVTAVVVYFAVQNSDNQLANRALTDAHTNAIGKIKEELAKTFNALKTISSVVQFEPDIDYKNAFLPIMDAGIPPYVNLIIYNDRVLSSDKDAYIAAKQSHGGLYANFTILSKQGADAQKYYPVALSNVPKAMEIFVHPGFDRYSEIAFLGSDIYEDASKNAFTHLETALQPAISDSFFSETSVDKDNKTVYRNSSILIMIPITNAAGNALRGAFSAHYSIDAMVADIVSGIDKNIFVTVYDANNTAINGGLIYNSLSLSDNADVVNALQGEMFTTVGYVNYLTRTYQLKFTSTLTYVEQKRGSSRWLGVYICAFLIVFGLGLCLSLFFFFRLRKSLRDRIRGKRALYALRDGHERTKMLLSRLAKQEAKARTTVDGIPDFIIVLSSTGRIIHTNKKFDKMFGYSATQLQQGLQITAVIPAFTANVFCEPKYSSEDTETYIRAIATTNTSEDIDVRCLVKNLNSTGMEKADAGLRTSVSTPISVPLSTPLGVSPTYFEMDEEEEAFAIIGRPVETETNDAFDLRKDKQTHII